jgi:hypothetical protein
MFRKTLAAVAATLIAGSASAAPLTYEMDLTVSYGSTYGGSAILAPVTWHFGFSFDPDTITPTRTSALGFNSSTFYDGTAGVTGYLRKGAEVATLDHVEAQFSTASLGRHSFTIRYVIDGRVPLWDPDCFRIGGLRCPDTDQDDGLTFQTSSGGASVIDANQVQFSFGGNRSTPTYFTGPGTLADTPLDWLDDPDALVGSTFNVYGYGIAGSSYGAMSAVADPQVGTLQVSSGLPAAQLPAVPLPAAGWMLLAALGGLAVARRRA